MNLKNAVTSLLDLFRESKGRRVIDAPAVPVAPLIQRLGLSSLPLNIKDDRRKAAYVFMEICDRFPKQISKRVLGKIVRHYGVDLHGYGFFRTMPAPRANILIIQRQQLA